MRKLVRFNARVGVGALAFGMLGLAPSAHAATLSVTDPAGDVVLSYPDSAMAGYDHGQFDVLAVSRTDEGTSVRLTTTFAGVLPGPLQVSDTWFVTQRLVFGFSVGDAERYVSVSPGREALNDGISSLRVSDGSWNPIACAAAAYSASATVIEVSVPYACLGADSASAARLLAMGAHSDPVNDQGFGGGTIASDIVDVTELNVAASQPPASPPPAGDAVTPISVSVAKVKGKKVTVALSQACGQELQLQRQVVKKVKKKGKAQKKVNWVTVRTVAGAAQPCAGPAQVKVKAKKKGIHRIVVAGNAYSAAALSKTFRVR